MPLHPRALRAIFTFRPLMLNKRGGNSAAWERAVTAVEIANVAATQAGILKGDRAKVFSDIVAPVLQNSKHPTSSEHFLREAAVLYDDWKKGKLTKK